MTNSALPVQALSIGERFHVVYGDGTICRVWHRVAYKGWKLPPSGFKGASHRVVFLEGGSVLPYGQLVVRSGRGYRFHFKEETR